MYINKNKLLVLSILLLILFSEDLIELILY